MRNLLIIISFCSLLLSIISCKDKKEEKRFLTEDKVSDNIGLPAIWIGKYATTFSTDSESIDSRDTDNIELIIQNDSIIFHVDRYMGEYKYLLKYQNVKNNLKLTFDKVIDGDETNTLKKVKDFGVLTYDGKTYRWQCPYIDTYYERRNKTAFILKKKKK